MLETMKNLLRTLICASLGCLSVPQAAAAESSVHVIVDASDTEFMAAPAEAVLTVPDHIDVATAEAIRRGNARPYLRTSSRAILPVDYRILPDDEGAAPTEVVLQWLEGSREQEYELVIDRAASADGMRQVLVGNWSIDRADREVSLRLDGKPVWTAIGTYDSENHEPTFKSFDHLYGHSGKRLTKGPGGLYSHHRGAFVGWSKTGHHGRVDDFWHGKKGAHYRTDAVVDDVSIRQHSATVRRSARWIGADGTEALRDTREVVIHGRVGYPRIFDYTITLEASGAPVVLDGDPQHAGFQFRAAQEVQESKTTYTRPAGAKDTGNDVWVDCAWVFGRFDIEGETHVVLHADHPDNPKSVYSTRDYGRFGSYFAGQLESGRPLVLRYRLAVLSGENVDRLTAESAEWLAAGLAANVRARVEVR